MYSKTQSLYSPQMEVFEFDKTKCERLLEISSVLRSDELQIPTSSVRNEWANFIEETIEPTGWQAVWRISRAVCEDLSVQFPTAPHGTVEQVLFDELKAIFVIDFTQDEELQLSEKQIVSLEELWPTREQENDALNVDQTANCIDQLRFFYQHVWMPWDNDVDDTDILSLQKHIDARVQLHFDIESGTISNRLSSHVLSLMAEANYIHKKKELLELGIEAHEDEEIFAAEDAEIVNKLMQLHLRMNTIKNEIEVLENPAMHKLYEKVHFTSEEKGNVDSVYSDRSVAEAFIVTHIGTLEQQLRYLSEAKAMIGRDKIVHICDSLQGVLNRCKHSVQLYLPPGKHTIKFLEYLNSGGAMVGVSSGRFVQAPEKQMFVMEEKVIVGSKDDDSILLTVDGDYCFENITLECANVRTGVLIKGGNVTFRNCFLNGDPKSSTKQGVVVFGNSTICFENCVIKGFSTGIYTNQHSEIHLLHSTIEDCINGVNVLQGCQINFDSSKIVNCKSYGAILEVDEPVDGFRLLCNDFNKINRQEFKFRGNCEFNNNRKADFIISNGNNADFNSSCYVDQTVPEGSCQFGSNSWIKA
ncbi:protein nessun dorma isoform X2 [Toxorhynchites rutilus septentrionalis]|uniref:protein nessun dorma isoform X2 n=1 Tax=Toxorhynchites rutilus septentrionalis TaxID=329112 RepID=UPI00247A23D2|nr:protein nessun dorma isoform X2 [Toxorhynchites rutilus septentrionalis]